MEKAGEGVFTVNAQNSKRLWKISLNLTGKSSTMQIQNTLWHFFLIDNNTFRMKGTL